MTQNGEMNLVPEQETCPVVGTSSSCIHKSGNKDANAVGLTCPINNDQIDSTAISTIPQQAAVGAGAGTARFQFDPSINDIRNEQHQLPGQTAGLSTQRYTSTIPKTEFTPGHQPSDAEKWVYPSEQQYYNAMRRKGYNPPPEDIPVILAIHNSVNEQGWSKILEWEALRGCPMPKLKRFMGRPNDMSPRARLLQFFGYKKPFDRHDWVVDRNGKEVRYVIDFYSGHSRGVSVFLDVRPALDSPAALFDRFSVLLRGYFKPWSLPLPLKLENGPKR